MILNATRTRRAFLCDLARLGGSLAGLGLLAGCAPAPPPSAPGPPRMYRVGLLATGQLAEVSPSPRTGESYALSEFWSRLAELGYVEGQNLTREGRRFVATSVDGVAPLDVRAAELVRLPVDVIVIGTSPPNIRAAMAATTSIPIVMIGLNTDPVAQGFAESLARPGGNVTGVIGAPAEVHLKRPQLLTEAVPGVSKVAVLGDAPDLASGAWISAAASLGVELISLPDPSRDGFESAFQYAVAERADGLVIRSGPSLGANAQLIGSLAARYRLPGISIHREFVTGGGLMAYEARASEIGRRAADYVDRILRGARPADLPIETPTRYDLVVNLRTARALGLTFSRDFLARIDEMIE